MNAASGAEAAGAVGGLDLFRAAVARAPEAPAIFYLDAALSYRELDEMSDALAARLAAGGFAAGDRLALFLQNSPHFVIGLLATWKAAGICVPINPMNRERELTLLFSDCRPRAVISQDDLFEQVVASVEAELIPPIVFRITPLEFLGAPEPRLFASDRPLDEDRLTRFSGLNMEGGERSSHRPEPDDIGLLVYTSGTTGRPKGAMISHAAFGFNSGGFCTVAQLVEGEPLLGIAPLFHITGSVACLGSALMMAAPLVLTYRFEPAVVMEAIERWQPRFVVAASTAFIGLYNDAHATRERLAGLTKIFSGGAPVPAAFVEQFEAKFGHYIHNCYGLTETTAATHITPLGLRAPVSPEGVLSIGKLAPGVRASVLDDGGEPSGPGLAGELVIQGPMVSPGYWHNPEETELNMRPDGFRTGDVAFYDDGWYYLVDRKKDVIISSGYKVWPREVEDVLYAHPAVREVAVVGVPDQYRGENVKAFVSLKASAAATSAELIDHCKCRMAAYKYPRLVDIIDELPKTPTGKILRRALRQP
jgi:long-chain acyl-CoA synthetase